MISSVEFCGRYVEFVQVVEKVVLPSYYPAIKSMYETDPEDLISPDHCFASENEAIGFVFKKVVKIAKNDLQLANYHEGISFENACRAYCGMIEGGEVNINRVRKLAPKSMVKVVNDYFHPDTDISAFQFPVRDRYAEIREIAQKYGAANGWTGTSGMLSSIIVELLNQLESQDANNP